MATVLTNHKDEALEFLVLAAQAGDRAAYGELVARFEGAIFRVALRRMGNQAEAEELCQEVFMHAMRKLPQLREPAAFGGWLKCMTNRMGINRLTRRKTESIAEPQTLANVSTRLDDPADQALAHERRIKLQAGLKRLRALDRETLTAFYLQGNSLLEMARSFNSPVGTIKRRLHMARKRLAAELGAEVA